MFNADHIPKVPTEGTETTAPSTAINTTTKDELLSRARAAIEAGEQSMLDAAEALGLAQEEHAATQREMAEAVGKSAAWVNALLKWRRSGYKDDGPFGPKTKAERVQHAEHRAKKFKSGRPKADAGAAVSCDSSVETFTDPSSATDGGDTEALAEFKKAVDRWICRMSPEARREALIYARDKAEASVI